MMIGDVNQDEKRWLQVMTRKTDKKKKRSEAKTTQEYQRNLPDKKHMGMTKVVSAPPYRITT